MKILMVLTSHEKLGNTQQKTGIWLEEFVAPYYLFKDAGAVITIASPLGGKPPLDPNSNTDAAQTISTHRFKNDLDAQHAFANSYKLDTIDADNFDGVFYPGGHGPLWDLSQSAASINLIEAMLEANKPVATVCHAQAALRYPKLPDGQSIIRGKKVTGFSNTEEMAVGLTQVVPFLIEDMLKANGGNYSKGNNWQPYVVVDGLLITGQNPASSRLVAKALLEKIKTQNHSQMQQNQIQSQREPRETMEHALRLCN